MKMTYDRSESSNKQPATLMNVETSASLPFLYSVYSLERLMFALSSSIVVCHARFTCNESHCMAGFYISNFLHFECWNFHY